MAKINNGSDIFNKSDGDKFISYINPIKVRFIMLIILISSAGANAYQVINKMNWIQLLESGSILGWLTYQVDSLAFWIFIGWVIYITFNLVTLNSSISKSTRKPVIILWLTSLVSYLILDLCISFSSLFDYTWAHKIAITALCAIISWINFEVNTLLNKKLLCRGKV